MRAPIAAALLLIAPAASADEGPHWSFVPPVKTGPPAVADADWPRGAVDRFTLARMEGAGLSPEPQQDPARLLRRLSLDLTGLPPSLAEVDAFVADPSDAAYEAAVDRLLASPHFGEKWAIGWLDLARYADSDGYQRDGFRNVWPYRDWVIRALNADMPYDQFTVEQLAGDLLPGATDAQRIATGFHRGPTLNLEAGTDPEEDRVKQVVDRVNTTGTVWLGISLECAQCHDHKYDPISIRDYYALYAFFNNTPVEGKRRPNGNDASMDYAGVDLPVPLTPEEQRRREAARGELDAARDRFVAKVDELCESLPEERMAELDEKHPRAAGLVRKEGRDFADAMAIKKAVFKDGAGAQALGRLEQQIKAHEKRANASGFQIGFSSRVMAEMEAPRETYVMQRGDFLQPGERVAAGTPPALHAFPAGAPRDRLGLARWIVADDNPLVARVAVNRLWAELFGRALVPSMEDFGRAGDKPTHPGLLDWLAVTFREDDAWSIKRTVRRLVLSSTYRQAAVCGASKRALDPDNALYARGPRVRLPAELVRDNALAVSGLLSAEMFGPPVRPPQPAGVWRVTGEVDNQYYTSEGRDLHRRGVYTIWRRSAHYPSFAAFDAPNRGACTVKREVSNTPLQALALMNDPAYVEMAEAFARRVQRETEGEAAPDRLAHAFRLAVARAPRDEELAALRALYVEALDTDGSEAGAWFEVATALLNLHETITK